MMTRVTILAMHRNGQITLPLPQRAQNRPGKIVFGSARTSLQEGDDAEHDRDGLFEGLFGFMVFPGDIRVSYRIFRGSNLPVQTMEPRPADRS